MSRVFLREIELIDFMCYEHLRIKPKHLTLIFGQNGSGKSAILEAISLAFGGLGRERQEVLRGFIRHGKTQAVIRLRLSNMVVLPNNNVVLLDPSMPPNATIVLERIIRHDGSIFKLDGRKTTKEEIISKLSRINISPKNVFYFVPQEKITKLVDMGPKERLDSLLASLGLLNLKEAIVRLREEIKQQERKKAEIEAKLSDLEAKIAEHRKMLSSLEESASVLKNYYVYRLAQLYLKRGKYLEQENIIRKKIESIDKRIEEHQAFINELPEKLRQIDDQIRKLQEERARCVSKQPEVDKRIEELENKAREISRRLDLLNKKRGEIAKKIGMLLKRWGKSSIDELRSLLEDKKSRLADIERYLESAEETKKIRELEKKLYALENELKELDGARLEMRRKLEELLGLLDPTGNVLKVYNFIVRERLTDEVQGPILLELSFALDEQTLRQYSVAIERALDRDIMKSFVALTPRALRRLLHFLKTLDGDVPRVFFFGPRRLFLGAEQQFLYFLHVAPREVINHFEMRRKSLREELKRDLNSFKR